MTLQAHNLDLQVGGRTLVKGLDWNIAPGQCWCVIGRNGVGKSTLLRALAGLRTPDVGDVSLDGRALKAWPLEQLARKRAYLPQGRGDTFSFTVLETVLAARHPYRLNSYWDTAQDRALALDALGAMDVQHLSERDVRSLSGGERQRVAIAAIMAQATPILLLDEPANALDLAHQAAVMQRLALLCKTEGKAVVLVSHDLNLVQAAATHALLLSEEGAWQAGTVADMLRAPLLSACLGHAIEAVPCNGRTVFLPRI